MTEQADNNERDDIPFPVGGPRNWEHKPSTESFETSGDDAIPEVQDTLPPDPSEGGDDEWPFAFDEVYPQVLQYIIENPDATPGKIAQGLRVKNLTKDWVQKVLEYGERLVQPSWTMPRVELRKSQESVELTQTKTMFGNAQDVAQEAKSSVGINADFLRGRINTLRDNIFFERLDLAEAMVKMVETFASRTGQPFAQALHDTCELLNQMRQGNL
jgi:hypothetical protein